MIIVPSSATILERAIVRNAQIDIPILENPIGSNRSLEIDEMCRRFGVPLGSAWCALWVAKCWSDAGAEIPPTQGDSHPARADSWVEWAKKTGRFTKVARFGAAPVYGLGRQQPASHIGCCVVSLYPILMDIEGNTSETGYSREGELTELKRVNLARLIGYVSPEPVVSFA